MVYRVWQSPRQRYSEEDWFSKGKLQETLVALAECRVLFGATQLGKNITLLSSMSIYGMGASLAVRGHHPRGVRDVPRGDPRPRPTSGTSCGNG